MTNASAFVILSEAKDLSEVSLITLISRVIRASIARFLAPLGMTPRN